MTTPLQKQLITEGYKLCESRENFLGKSTNVLYQKRIRDDNGTRYFIDAYYYPSQKYTTVVCPESFQVDAQLSWAGGDVFNITLLDGDIKTCENRLKVMWEGLNLDYYETY
jgi:hypothetical protein